MTDLQQKRRSALALFLLIPAPTIGVLFGMILAPGKPLGVAVFALSKIWILALPLAWHLVVERLRPSLSPVRRGGLAAGAALGTAIGAVILAGYFLVGRPLIDPAAFREPLRAAGLGTPAAFLAGTAYWVLVNSVLEEYVWRWFTVSRFQDLVSGRAAVALSAAAFTLHHVFAMQVYLSGLVTAVASLGIFIGGVVWSWCYVRYDSIWPGYVSHAIVDLAVFGLGHYICFAP